MGKTNLTTAGLFAALLLLLPACQALKPSYDGTWHTNIARLILDQNQQDVTGLLEGYGGNWNQEITGTINGNTLTFSSENPLGISAIELDDGGNTFHSTDPDISFCGSRSSRLPNGCGFSGKWNLNAPDLFPTGSYTELQQDADKVSGSIFDANGAVLMQVDSKVTWGKGWQATWQNYAASMTNDEKAFLISLESSGAKEWCALRDGLTSAYVLFFTCSIP